MRRSSRQIGRVLLNGLLLAGLVGLLFAYAVAVTDLPSRVYTSAQREVLRANIGRSISQAAPTWNIVQTASEGYATLTIFPGQESHVRAILAARYEERSGVSVTVYDLDFHGEYLLSPSNFATSPDWGGASVVELVFPFPANLDTLHEVRFTVDGEEPPDAQYTTQSISWSTVLRAGEEHRITISYRADGANSFAYGLHHNQRSDVDVTVTVSGLVGSEVPKTSLPLTASDLTDEGETFTWDYKDLIANRDIRLTLPARLSFAQRVARLQGDFRTLANLAPLLIGLFLASLAGVLHLSGVHLRLESYLLMGFGLALFYPLLTFLSALVNVAVAAVLALLLVSGLLLVFLSLAVGWRRIRWRVGVLLAIFLGAFSLGVLTPWRGLFLTTGGLMLVATFMVHWAGWARRASTEPEPEPTPTPAEIGPAGRAGGPAPEPTMVDAEPPEAKANPEPVGLYCPYCARELADDYRFCPGCGHDTSSVRRCAACGHAQFVEADLAPAYCLHCGQVLSQTSRSVPDAFSTSSRVERGQALMATDN